MKNIKRITILVVLVFAGMVNVISVKAQTTEKKPVVQFSGLVVAGDSLFGLEGVHIINKNSKKGWISGASGYFSMAALEGDSILFSFVGFKARYLVVPKDVEDKKVTMIVELILDTTQLDAIEVLPYPTIELFKEAFVRLELPDDPLHQNMAKNLDQKKLRRMMAEMGMTADMNYTHYSLEQIKKYEQPNFVATSQIMNPFAWVKVIKAIKNGEFKRKTEDDE